MKLYAGRHLLLLLLVPVFLNGPFFGQVLEHAAPSAAIRDPLLSQQHLNQGHRAFPRATLPGGTQVEYLGVFSADAKFHSNSKFNRFLDGLNTSTVATVRSGAGVANSDAPPWMILPRNRTIEDLEPPTHATAEASPSSEVAGMRNSVVTFAYGRLRVLQSPKYLAADSAGRVIVSDPAGAAVHVIDPKGANSFSISAGQGRRLKLPAGVAVDADDNIYVADSDRGMVLVYDKFGTFTRYIGNYHGENWFQGPTAIAIDRRAGRLYLADSPLNRVLVLDLQGNVLKRVGKAHDGSGLIGFDNPTEIALTPHGVAVLDSSGTRIQILDLSGSLLRTQTVFTEHGRVAYQDDGLAADLEGNLYVSLTGDSVVRVYRWDGTPLGTFGESGNRLGQFNAPHGLAVDTQGRLYVADADNSRVQVFRVKARPLALASKQTGTQGHAAP